MAFIGFTIFYSLWIPYFENKIQPLREVIDKHELY